MRIVFWPDSANGHPYAVGWKMDEIYCISDTIDEESYNKFKSINGEKVLGYCFRGSEKEIPVKSKDLNMELYIQIDRGAPIAMFNSNLNLTLKAWIIYFTPPRKDSLQFYSIEPLILDLRTKEVDSDLVQIMRQKLSLYRQDSPQIISNGNLEDILKKINSVKPPKPTLNFATQILQTRIAKGILLNYPLKFLQLLQLIIVILNLESYSHTAQQLNLRIQQLQFWPAQYYEWQQSEVKLSPNSQAQYIGFFNTVWLIVNDIILGFAIKKSLVINSHEISKYISDFLMKTTIMRLNLVIDWLMRWPAGLKLNAELAVFLANLFQWMLGAWQIVLVQAVLYLPTVIYFIGCSGVFGATLTISMLSDLLNFLTIHVKLLYIISARIFNWSIFIIDSTWNLFRGKKRNPLRNRIDSAEYDLDQLLLGAIIFTLLVFLLPTVGAIINISLIQIFRQILLAFLNHFPLFALMLRVKDSQRLSEGVFFKPCEPNSIKKFSLLRERIIGNEKLNYFYLQNQPIAFGTIFFQYQYIYEQIMSFYFTKSSLNSILTGARIQSMPPLQFPTMTKN